MDEKRKEAEDILHSLAWRCGELYANGGCCCGHCILIENALVNASEGRPFNLDYYNMAESRVAAEAERILRGDTQDFIETVDRLLIRLPRVLYKWR